MNFVWVPEKLRKIHPKKINFWYFENILHASQLQLSLANPTKTISLLMERNTITSYLNTVKPITGYEHLF